MNNKKLILSSILSLALCLSIIVGGTFALATSNSQVNIAVQSGSVNVTATIANLKTYSAQANAELTGYDEVEQPKGTFVNGGTAKIENGTLILDRMIHGDKATFDIILENKSNIDVQYQTIIQAVEDTGLFDGLQVTINEVSYTGSVIQSDWASLKASETQDTAIATWTCSVELPINADSSYQNKSTKIAIGVNAVQGNAIVTAASIGDVHYKTFADAVAAAKSGDVVVVSGDALAVTMPATVADGVTIKNATFNTPVYVTAAAATAAEGDEATDSTESTEPTAPEGVVFDSCTFSGNALLSVADRNVVLNSCTFIDIPMGNAEDYTVLPYVYQASGAATVTLGEKTTATVTIKSVEKWVEMATVLNALNDQSYLIVKLGADLDFTGVTGYQISNLGATIDGQGHTVSNLTGNLFGTVSGTVKNLNVENVNVLNTTKGGANNGFIKTVADGGVIDNCTVSGVDIQWTGTIKDMTDGFGGVICQVQAGATVQNCEFTDISVTTYGKTKRTGGVFDGITGTVKDCVFTNVNFAVVDKDGIDGYVSSYGGGLAAVVNGGAVVENCVVNNMQVNVDDGGHLGGIFGKAHINGQTAPITLKNITVNGLTMNVGNGKDGITCIAGFIAQPDSRTNNVRVAIDNCHIYGLDMTLIGKPGESAAAGFISGLCGGVDVTNCSVSGKIDATKATVNVGGFVGDAGWYGSIEQNFTDCVANVDITVKDSIGGGFIAVDGVLSKAGVYSGTATLNFTNCKATGTVTVVDGGTGTADAFCGKTIE